VRTQRRPLLLLLLLAALCAVAVAQGPKKEKILPVMSDVKFIDCAVCGEVAKVVHRTVGAMRKELPAGKKLKEADIMDKLEGVCDPEKDEGEWVTHFDLVEENHRLKLKDMGGVGDCKRECQTVARACDGVFFDYDTDIAEALFKNADMTRASLFQLLCYELQDVCPDKPIKMGKTSRPHDEEWEEIDPEKLKLQKMMAQMQMEGMPGMSMYSKDEMMQQMEQYDEDYGSDEDSYAGEGDEEDDYGFPEDQPVVDHDLSTAEIMKAAANKAAESVKGTVESAYEGAQKLTESVSSSVKKLFTKTDSGEEL